VMIIVSVAAGVYAGRGLIRAFRTFVVGRRTERGQ
jgi:hypothetical protein